MRVCKIHPTKGQQTGQYSCPIVPYLIPYLPNMLDCILKSKIMC